MPGPGAGRGGGAAFSPPAAAAIRSRAPSRAPRRRPGVGMPPITPCPRPDGRRGARCWRRGAEPAGAFLRPPPAAPRGRPLRRGRREGGGGRGRSGSPPGREGLPARRHVGLRARPGGLPAALGASPPPRPGRRGGRAPGSPGRLFPPCGGHPLERRAGPCVAPGALPGFALKRAAAWPECRAVPCLQQKARSWRQPRCFFALQKGHVQLQREDCEA